jgi:hypothetical protein
MSTFSRKSPITLAGCFLAIALTLTACGGGGSSSRAPVPTPAPTPAPTPDPAGSLQGGVAKGIIIAGDIEIREVLDDGTLSDVLGTAVTDDAGDYAA